MLSSCNLDKNKQFLSLSEFFFILIDNAVISPNSKHLKILLTQTITLDIKMEAFSKNNNIGGSF